MPLWIKWANRGIVLKWMEPKVRLDVSVVVRLLLISTANAEDSKTDQFDK